MKYYEVEAKCGHVGRNNYILKRFYICAINGKEAARIARSLPRVKHHHKDAIRYVKELTFDAYCLGKKETENDAYFKVFNHQDQIRYCDLSELIVKEKDEDNKKKQSHIKKKLIELLLIKEWKAERNLIYE